MAAACGELPVRTAIPDQLRAGGQPPQTQKIPPPAERIVAVAKPRPMVKTETYSVAVNNVPAAELLIALARDANLNIDIHQGISGAVTLNAIDQTLPQLLNRIAKQADMRWELDGANLAVMPDTPYLRNYRVDYINMSRDASGSVSISTQIGTNNITTAAASAVGSGSNASTSKIDNSAKNRFWETLDKNLKEILHETDKILPEGSSETVIERRDQQATSGTGSASPPNGHGRANAAPSNIAASPNPVALQQQGTTVVRRTTFREAASVITNAEGNIIVVRASSRQHEKVQEFLSQIMANARRQVLVEATIAEIRLADQYQQGINWQSLRTLRNPPGTAGFSLAQNPTGLDLAGNVPNPFATAGTSFLLNYVAPGLGISSTISLLETFGKVRVLSSPKISVLNNQTALLKVVNNIVYFEIQATTSQGNYTSLTTVSTTPRSVSVGLVMTITPQISENGTVLLNVRPSISRINGYKSDPNPNIPAGLSNLVPEIETRELESLLRLNNGEIAVMGGLMQDSTDNTTNAVPVLSSIPLIGNLFKQRNETSNKTELIIFLRPIIINDPSISGDFAGFLEKLPKTAQSFAERNEP